MLRPRNETQHLNSFSVTSRITPVIALFVSPTVTAKLGNNTGFGRVVRQGAFKCKDGYEPSIRRRYRHGLTSAVARDMQIGVSAVTSILESALWHEARVR